ncbi:MAG: hypothetical protein LC105_08170 [Chitinophagales bacterium]|nr:hypothetical protein [Chitinophagales bacterium]MCZ2393814.1 hypothetical protein [Chitinophagales bacterium]
MNKNNRNKIKEDLSSNQIMSDFDKEAQEGWENIGFENWEDIHQKLDYLIDQQTITISKSESISKTSIWKKLSIPMSIAAVFLIAIGIGISILYEQPKDTNISLYTEYYRPLDAPEDNFRGEEKTQDIESKAKQASDAYDELEYKKSIMFYSELLAESPNNSKYTLFLGLSYINTGEYDKAILLFNNHAPQNSNYDEDIQWYLALAHLRRGEIQTSKAILESISHTKNNYYSSSAGELYNKLSQLK